VEVTEQEYQMYEPKRNTEKQFTGRIHSSKEMHKGKSYRYVSVVDVHIMSGRWQCQLMDRRGGGVQVIYVIVSFHGGVHNQHRTASVISNQWVLEHWWNKTKRRKNTSTRKEICPSATFCSKNPKFTGLGSNPERPRWKMTLLIIQTNRTAVLQ
jgi:hypothetical protein